MVAIRIRPAIVLFGDSITQQGFGVDGKVGWASLLASDYSRRADVLNRGFSGYNTKMAVELLPSVFPNNATTAVTSDDTNDGLSGGGRSGILFCTIFFGANDAALPGERQHVPIQEYGQNLEKIITSIREATQLPDDNGPPPPIILVTPPPFDAASWRKARHLQIDGRSNDAARSYGNEAKRVGISHDCSVLDSWEALEGETPPEVYGRYLSDGLHLNEEGNRRVHESLVDLIKNLHPEVAPAIIMDEEGGASSSSAVGIPLDGKLWDELC